MGGDGFALSDKFAANHIQHTIQLDKDFVVPEPQYREASRSQESRSSCVVDGVIKVLTAINFDDHVSLKTSEVENVVAIGMLTTELASFDLASSQMTPEPLLCVRWRGAQISLQMRGEDVAVGLAFHRSRRSNTIPTQPSP